MTPFEFTKFVLTRFRMLAIATASPEIIVGPDPSVVEACPAVIPCPVAGVVVAGVEVDVDSRVVVAVSDVVLASSPVLVVALAVKESLVVAVEVALVGVVVGV
jgi:hypothetical protein